jgi:uncharacterized SAM-binding protein YcdF (DUF218 family)
MIRRLAFAAVAAIVGINVVLGAAGYVIFGRAPSNPLSEADAIVVLAGEHDGREEYGISLAQRGWASTVVLSDPYRRDDALMRRLCDARYDKIEVICSRSDAKSTRGEAIMARELSAQRHWQRLIVVTWKFHLPRARLIFSQCLSPSTVVSYVAVPRQYLYSVTAWEFQYMYQYASLMKNLAAPQCR